MSKLKKYELINAFSNSKATVILQPSLRKFNLAELTDKEAAEMLKLGFKHIQKKEIAEKSAKDNVE